MKLFPDAASSRTVIRNAARLFPEKPTDIDPATVRMRYEALVRDNTRKQLGAELELKLRALYYDRIEDVATVEKTVAGMMAFLPSLEDVTFVLEHAKELLPAAYKDIDGKALFEGVQALRAKIAEERAAAIASLTAAMQARYPDREPRDVQVVAATIAEQLQTAIAIRSLAAECAEVFPEDFASVKPGAVLRAFAALQKEKGL